MARIYRGPEKRIFSPNTSIGIYMDEKIKQFGNNEALICGVTGQKVSYAQLRDQSLRIAAVFRDLGVTQGDVVSIISENNLDFFPVVLGTFFAGATIAPINPTYVEHELEHCILISRPKLTIASPLVAPRVVPAVNKMAADGRLSRSATCFIMGSGSAPNLLQLAAKVKNTQNLPLFVDNAANKTSFIMCSSGTTGLPKGVELSNLNVIETINFLHDDRLMHVTTRDVLLGLLPFFHMYGLTLGLFVFSYGCQFVVLPKFQDTLFLNALQNYRVTMAHLVPPLLVFLGKHPLVAKYDLSCLREIWSGAAPLSGEMQQTVAKRLGKDIIRQAYGLTETTLAVSVNPLKANRIGSSGKLVPGIKCKVVDIETGAMLGPGQPGELCFYGDTVMKGYKDNPKATDAMIDNAGWLRSGDIGYFDEDEYLYITDRIKELIKYKGLQVAPAELEALLLTHPGIQDSAIVGLPDERAGELPFAFVVLQPGAKLTEKQIFDFVADRISVAKRLHGGVKIVSSIPKTASGKILRKNLREMLKAKPKL